MEDPARFAAVLNGVVKRTFENDQQITPAFIKEQVFPQHEDVSVDDVAAMFDRCVSLVGESAYHNRQPAQLQQALKKARLSTTRRVSDFSATQQEIIVKFWTLNKDKLHAKVRKNAMWGTELHKFAWRIDVKSKARAVSEMNEPVAIVELTLGKKVPYLHLASR
ncbi:COMM domain containing protein 1, putative, partial [Acanthamoeba castellanii str. Neff]